MKHWDFLPAFGGYSFVFCVLMFSTTFAQTRFIVSGLITDSASRDGLASVNIRVVETSYGTVTNSIGYYTLSVEKGNHTFVFSLIGYQPETLSVKTNESGWTN